MALAPTACDNLIQVLPSQYRDHIIDVYNEMPASLLLFLQQEDVIKVINFDDTLSVNGELGSEKNKTWDTFRMDLRKSIEEKFTKHGVIQCIKPEELSDYISKEYLKERPNWAKRGETLSAIVRLNKSYSDTYKRYINAYIYARITEECEDNLIFTNAYKYTYYISMELKGISVNETLATQFCQLVSQDVPAAKAHIKQVTKSQLTWNAFTKNS
jgi:hypothetical protein